MRITVWRTLLLLAMLTLWVPPVLAGQDPVVDRADIVKKANWKTMQTVTVEMDEHSYDPETLIFRVGQPYRLVLKNDGEKKHYFTAPAFYQAIATRKVQANGMGEIKAPYVLALEMMAKGGQLDLYFVPVTKGTYPVYCTIDDHREQGMDGKIIIQ